MAFLMSEELLADIRAVIDAYKGGIGKTRAKTQSPTDEAPSSDIYCARTPPGGIAGVDLGVLLGTGTGTHLEDEVFSSAGCDVYEILDDGTIVPVELAVDVFNLFTTAIEGDTWVPVGKDKFGRWLALGVSAVTGSGGFVGTQREISVNVAGTTDTIPTYTGLDYNYGGFTYGSFPSTTIVPENGLYEIGFHIDWYAISVTTMWVRIKINGTALTTFTDFVKTHTNEVGDERSSQGRIHNKILTAGDTVSLELRHSNPFNADAIGKFWVHKRD